MEDVKCDCGECIFCTTKNLKCPNCESPNVQPHWIFTFGYRNEGEDGIWFDFVNRTLYTECFDCKKWCQMVDEFDPPSGKIWDALKLPMETWRLQSCRG